MTTIEYGHLYIDGQWAAPASAERIRVTEAATEEHLGSVPAATERDIDAAVGAARKAFDDADGWATWSPARRGDVLERFAAALEARGAETARRVSVQNGMPLWLAQNFEAGFPALLLRYYAGLVAAGQEEVRAGMLGKKSLIRREPIGVVGAIVPWNVPQAISFLKLAPALAAGDTVVLKPAPETVLDAFLMAEAALEAGLPPGVLNVVPAGREAGAYLVAHPGVDKVSFTGSTAAGRLIAEICWLSTRVLAPRSRYDAVVETITALAQSLTIGDPLDPATKIGPLVSERQRHRVESYIAKGQADGARITTGGRRPEGFDRGWFVEPTIFAGVDPKATIAQEEIFGPVLAVIPYADEQEAIAIANDSEYGLGGSVWTSDPERGASFARKVRSGTIGVNGYVNDPFAPFGGIKASGMGRELGPEGLQPFQLLKTIYLDEANDPA